MNSSTQSNQIKIAIVGPQRVGKTVLANSIAEYSTVVPNEYRPTVGVRILECEKEYTDDQIKSIQILKNSNTNKVKIQLWDCSGDKRYDRFWPAIQQDLKGVIIVIDSKNTKYDNILDEWMNNFCKGINMDNVLVMSNNKDEEGTKAGETKQKICKFIIKFFS
jgi:Rab-like protein 5